MAGQLNIGDAYPEPAFCRRCNERLYEAAAARCTECGLEYDGRDPATFRTAPMFLRWKFWFPGLALSIVSGVLSYAVCLTSGGGMGAALFVAVPISMGAMLGYATRVKLWLIATLSMVAIACVVFTLASLNLLGVFCGLTLGIIFLGPLWLGIVLGLILRTLLAGSRWNQRWFLPLLLFALLPYGVQAIEDTLPRRREQVEVHTELVVDAEPRRAWQSLMFYEEVRHDPPWLLRLALPKPIRSEGDKRRAGQLVRCIYDRGWLVKRITAAEPGRRLDFEVVEQHLHFERDVRLLGGRFSFEPIEVATARSQAIPGRTRVVLSTRYERLLWPRFVWEPIERQVIHTLHAHVLEGMRREAIEPQEQTGPAEFAAAAGSP